MELPAFIQVEPDDWKPVEECTRDEILAASAAYMTNAVMGAREAVAVAEAAGPSPLSADMMTKAGENRELALALDRYADQPF